MLRSVRPTNATTFGTNRVCITSFVNHEVAGHSHGVTWPIALRWVVANLSGQKRIVSEFSLDAIMLKGWESRKCEAASAFLDAK